MRINSTAHIHNAHSIRPAGKTHSAADAQPGNKAQATDELQISQEASFASQVKDIPDIRADKVAQIRAEIESGAYETSDKIDIALERLLDELA